MLSVSFGVCRSTLRMVDAHSRKSIVLPFYVNFNLQLLCAFRTEFLMEKELVK